MEPRPRPRKYKRLTWGAVMSLLNAPINAKGLSNREIAQAGGFEYGEVIHLTRIMWKAGVINRRLIDVEGPAKLVYYGPGF